MPFKIRHGNRLVCTSPSYKKRQAEWDCAAALRRQAVATAPVVFVYFPFDIRTSQEYHPVPRGLVYETEARYGLANPTFWSWESDWFLGTLPATRRVQLPPLDKTNLKVNIWPGLVVSYWLFPSLTLLCSRIKGLMAWDFRKKFRHLALNLGNQNMYLLKIMMNLLLYLELHYLWNSHLLRSALTDDDNDELCLLRVENHAANTGVLHCHILHTIARCCHNPRTTYMWHIELFPHLGVVLKSQRHISDPKWGHREPVARAITSGDAVARAIDTKWGSSGSVDRNLSSGGPQRPIVSEVVRGSLPAMFQTSSQHFDERWSTLMDLIQPIVLNTGTAVCWLEFLVDFAAAVADPQFLVEFAAAVVNPHFLVGFAAAVVNPHFLVGFAAAVADPQFLVDFAAAVADPQFLVDFAAAVADPQFLVDFAAAVADPQFLVDFAVPVADPQFLVDFAAVVADPQFLVDFAAAVADPQFLVDFAAAVADPQFLVGFAAAVADPQFLVGFAAAVADPQFLVGFAAAVADLQFLVGFAAAVADPQFLVGFAAFVLDPQCLVDFAAAVADRQFLVDFAAAVADPQFLVGFAAAVADPQFLVDFAAAVADPQFLVDFAAAVADRQFLVDFASAVADPQFLVDFAAAVADPQFLVDFAAAVADPQFLVDFVVVVADPQFLVDFAAAVADSQFLVDFVVVVADPQFLVDFAAAVADPQFLVDFVVVVLGNHFLADFAAVDLLHFLVDILVLVLGHQFLGVSAAVVGNPQPVVDSPVVVGNLQTLVDSAVVVVNLQFVVDSAAVVVNLQFVVDSAAVVEDLQFVVDSAAVVGNLQSLVDSAVIVGNLQSLVDSAGVGANLLILAGSAAVVGNLQFVVDSAAVVEDLQFVVDSAAVVEDLQFVVDSAAVVGNLHSLVDSAVIVGNLQSLVDSAGVGANLLILAGSAAVVGNLQSLVDSAVVVGNLQSLVDSAVIVGNLQSVVDSAGVGANLLILAGSAGVAGNPLFLVDSAAVVGIPVPSVANHYLDHVVAADDLVPIAAGLVAVAVDPDAAGIAVHVVVLAPVVPGPRTAVLGLSPVAVDPAPIVVTVGLRVCMKGKKGVNEAGRKADHSPIFSEALLKFYFQDIPPLTNTPTFSLNNQMCNRLTVGAHSGHVFSSQWSNTWILRLKKGATVAEWLACLPPTKANWVQSPAGSLPDFPKQYGWSESFLGDLPFPPLLHSGTIPFSPHFTLICSQDLVVKNFLNLSTQLITLARPRCSRTLDSDKGRVEEMTESTRPGFDSQSGHPDFGFPWFSEITPGKCWNRSQAKAVANSFPILPPSLFPLKLAPSLMTSLQWGSQGATGDRFEYSRAWRYTDIGCSPEDDYATADANALPILL
ncbi:hypothetical protein PR048_004463 [Dryococelus australis]|uniref:C2 domain-containing protein n=1 Tax=Dryococelus australis TaxID=614101 RepID=A0ABQ9I5Z2_9NEOP|nr:hypothetical protein PR048_004463 [Dryococelus australis]